MKIFLTIIACFLVVAESGQNGIGLFDMSLYLQKVYKDIDWYSIGIKMAESDKMRLEYFKLRACLDSLKNVGSSDTLGTHDSIISVCEKWDKVSNECKPSKLSQEIYQKYGPNQFEILDTLYRQACKRYSIKVIIDKYDLHKLYPEELDTNEYVKLPSGMLKKKHFFSEPIKTIPMDTANKIKTDITEYMINNWLQMRSKIKH